MPAHLRPAVGQITRTGTPRSRTYLTTSAVPIPEPIRMFFPPKWGINDKVSDRPVISGDRPTQEAQEALL